jgi:riboflavin kinase/FMN adenylyltransferase
MEVIESESQLVDLAAGAVLTIGNFDGVHIGHQEILTIAKQTAAQRKSKLVVMTFEPHPLAVLHPQEKTSTLTPLALKKCLLAEFGVDCLFVLKSTLELLSLSPADFVEQFIVKNIQPGVVVEGESFNFGCGRTGGTHTLQELGAEKGFEVSVIKAKEVKLLSGRAVKISSTIIRNMLNSGKVADAAVALGRPYRLIGRVVPGRGKGKQLGFPTLNLEKPQQLVPAEGVYAGTAEVAESIEEVCNAKGKIPAALSIGRTSTYGNDNPLLMEAHLLVDNAEQLTGRWMAIDFIERIRDQQKFKTEKKLSQQIAKDCEKAKNILATKKE